MQILGYLFHQCDFLCKILGKCNFLAIYFITAICLMLILGYLFHYCEYLANATFPQAQKSHQARILFTWIFSQTDQSSLLYGTSHERTSERMSTHCPTYITAISLHLTSHKTRKLISKGFHSFAKHIPWVSDKITDKYETKNVFLKIQSLKVLLSYVNSMSKNLRN